MNTPDFKIFYCHHLTLRNYESPTILTIKVDPAFSKHGDSKEENEKKVHGDDWNMPIKKIGGN